MNEITYNHVLILQILYVLTFLVGVLIGKLFCKKTED